MVYRSDNLKKVLIPAFGVLTSRRIIENKCQEGAMTGVAGHVELHLPKLSRQLHRSGTANVALMSLYGQMEHRLDQCHSVSTIRIPLQDLSYRLKNDYRLPPRASVPRSAGMEPTNTCTMDPGRRQSSACAPKEGMVL